MKKLSKTKSRVIGVVMFLLGGGMFYVHFTANKSIQTKDIQVQDWQNARASWVHTCSAWERNQELPGELRLRVCFVSKLSNMQTLSQDAETQALFRKGIRDEVLTFLVDAVRSLHNEYPELRETGRQVLLRPEYSEGHQYFTPVSSLESAEFAQQYADQFIEKQKTRKLN